MHSVMSPRFNLNIGRISIYMRREPAAAAGQTQDVCSWRMFM